jgi:hypothetical protein
MGCRVDVVFAEHMSSKRVRDMVSSIAAYGNVLDGGTPREFIVDVFRPSKLPELKKQLLSWERYGFLTWTERPNSN